MLPKKERLVDQKEIRAAIKGKEFEGRSPLLYLTGRESAMNVSRLVIITPKKLGKATVRNRLRRVFCEAFKRVKGKLNKCIDLAIFPKQKACDYSIGEIAMSIEEALSKQKLC